MVDDNNNAVSPPVTTRPDDIFLAGLPDSLIKCPCLETSNHAWHATMDLFRHAEGLVRGTAKGWQRMQSWIPGTMGSPQRHQHTLSNLI